MHVASRHELHDTMNTDGNHVSAGVYVVRISKPVSQYDDVAGLQLSVV